MPQAKLKIIFFGTPQFAVPSLSKLLVHPEFQVLAVVTQPDKRRGRGNQQVPSPVKAIALDYRLPVWQPQNLKKDAKTLTQLQAFQADAFVVVAYGQILSQQILEIPRLGCINSHGSILPKYRGAAPIQWALYQGATETGVTTMLMDAGMDTGAILLKSCIPVGLLDDAESIAKLLSIRGADLLIETLLKLDRQAIQPIPQDSPQATYAPLIRKQDYGLDWCRSHIELHNQIRGFFPNCVALFRTTPLKIRASAPLGDAYWTSLPPKLQALQDQYSEACLKPIAIPGEVVGIAKNLGPIVQTGKGLLLLREVQLAGKRIQSGSDFANGVRLATGEVLASSH